MTLFLATVASYGNEESSIRRDENGYIIPKEQTIEMYDFNNFNLFEYDDYLNLSNEQKMLVTPIMEKFYNNMGKAYYSKNRKKNVLNSINKNLSYMRDNLDKYQYHMYLRVLNLEFNRRGIDLY